MQSTNCTYYANDAIGGNGGNGGDNTSNAGSSVLGGRGGDGGAANGGAIRLALCAGCPSVHSSCTINGNSISPGLGGSGGRYNSVNGAAGSGNGGGLYTGEAILENTIVAGNNSSGFLAAHPEVYTMPGGFITSGGYNLVGDSSGITWAAGSPTSGDQLGTPANAIDPRLGPLQDNGGLTPTLALLAGSPAIDAGSSHWLVDQRGYARPVDLNDALYPNASGGNGADIGAFELDNLPGPTVSNLHDSGPGSLREAIQDAGAAHPPAVVFATNLAGVITLTSGELDITNNLILLGPGPKTLTVDGAYNGPVFNVTNGVVSISGLTIANGVGNIYNSATLSVSNCVIMGSDWSGVGNSGTMALNGCTISSNSAGIFGGAIYNSGTLGLTNCTVSGNRKGSSIITGIENIAGALTIISSTICSNLGGASGKGGLVIEGGTVAIGNTLFAGNTARFNPDVSGAVVSLGYNFISATNGSSGWVASDIVGTAATRIDAVLGPLQDNGGGILTHALSPGSPALDAGTSFGLLTDARGLPRVVDLSNVANALGSDGSDIGAFEMQRPRAVAPFLLMAPQRLGNGAFKFSFTNTPGAGFTVLTSTNLVLPFSQWSRLGSPNEVSSGLFQFMDPQAANRPSGFYRVTSP
jgi:hypothetical protein